MSNVIPFPLKKTDATDPAEKLRASIAEAVKKTAAEFQASLCDFCVVIVGQQDIERVAESIQALEPRFLVKAFAGANQAERAKLYRYPAHHILVMSVGVYRRDRLRWLEPFAKVNRLLIVTDHGGVNIPGAIGKRSLTCTANGGFDGKN